MYVSKQLGVPPFFFPPPDGTLAQSNHKAWHTINLEAGFLGMSVVFLTIDILGQRSIVYTTPAIRYSYLVQEIDSPAGSCYGNKCDL